MKWGSSSITIAEEEEEGRIGEEEEEVRGMVMSWIFFKLKLE